MARVGLCACVCGGCYIGNEAGVSQEEDGAFAKGIAGIRSYIIKKDCFCNPFLLCYQLMMSLKSSSVRE